MEPFPCDSSSDSNVRILLVDNDDAVRDELLEGLALRNLDACAATGAIDCLALSRGDKCIAVLVTDVRMPNGDGITIEEQVLREFDGVRAVEVIVLTGHATLNTVTDATRLRISDPLCKQPDCPP